MNALGGHPKAPAQRANAAFARIKAPSKHLNEAFIRVNALGGHPEAPTQRVNTAFTRIKAPDKHLNRAFIRVNTLFIRLKTLPQRAKAPGNGAKAGFICLLPIVETTKAARKELPLHQHHVQPALNPPKTSSNNQ